MTNNKIYVLITMDCERAVVDTDVLAGKPGDGRQSGPQDDAAGERSIQGYWNLAARFEFPVTYFIHPELAETDRELFLGLQAQGACLGLHLHPWKFGNGRYPGHLGGFPEDTQRRMLSEAMEIWESGLGQRPLYFRPGTFSANDATFRVLHDLGFHGGSISCPGRVWPEFYSAWSGTEPYPHRAHPYFRLCAGDLPFVEVPLTVDFCRPLETFTPASVGVGTHRIDGEPVHRSRGIHGYHDLRPDRDVDHAEIVRDVLKQLLTDNPTVKTVSLVTHNDHDFEDSSHSWSRRLVTTLAAIRSVSGELGIEPIGATVADVCDLVLKGN